MVILSGVSVSKKVKEILEQKPSLVHELQQRKTPQRTVAKKILDMLLEEGHFKEIDGQKLEGNIAVCITRHLKRLREEQEDQLGIKKVRNILTKGTTEITDGLKHYKISYANGETDYSRLLDYVIKQIYSTDICSAQIHTDGVELYVRKMAESKFLQDIGEFEDLKFIKLQDSLSLLKLMLPQEASQVPGILAHVSSLLADQAISIYDTQIFHSDKIINTFVINETAASKARDILMKVIKKEESN